MTRCSLPSSSRLPLGSPQPPCTQGCSALRGEGREKFPIPSFTAIRVTIPVKLSFLKKAQKTFFFPKGSFFTLPSCSLPWVMLTHLLVLGCPALETSTNPPTPPGEAMPSIEEATLILFLGFSCWVGAKGCSINEVSQLAKSVPNSLGAVGREHGLLVRPSGWMGWLIPLKREPKKKKRTRINL